MVVQKSQKVCKVKTEFNNFRWGTNLYSCLYSLQKTHLEYSLACDIIDTAGSCKPMNKGCKLFVWWESPLATIQVQIGEFFLIWYWNPLALPYMVIGQPQWSWNTTTGQGNTVSLYTSNIWTILTVCQLIRLSWTTHNITKINGDQSWSLSDSIRQDSQSS